MMIRSRSFLTAHVPAWKWEAAKDNTSGVECVFVRWIWPSIPGLPQMSLKVYATLREATEACQRQQKAHKIELAPEVYGVCRVEVEGVKRRKYGVLTQHAMEFRLDARGLMGSSPGACSKALRDLERRAESELPKIGMEHWDVCERNVGWVTTRSGVTRLVIVDWGSESSGPTDG